MSSTIKKISDLVIADTQVLVIEGLKAIFEKEGISGITIVHSKDALLEVIHQKIPSMVIMDYFMLDFENHDDLQRIINQFPEMPVVIMTNTLTRNEIVALNTCGIRNILHKTSGQEEIFDCIDFALKGKKYYSGSVLDLLMDAGEGKTGLTSTTWLTASEIEIVRLIADGLTNKEIAQKKTLSVHTIMTHRKNVMRKLGASNASEMIMFAIKSGIIDNIEYHI